MTQRSWVAGLAVVLSLTSTIISAQQPTFDGDRAPGRMEAAGGPPMTPSGDPYQMNPGHYVVPGPDAPDYWSPHLRPFPDYSYERSPFSAPLSRSHTPFRHYGRQPASNGASTYGCGPVFGGGHAYGYAAPFCGDTADAYNQGRYDADREYNWFLASQRAGRLLNQHSAMFDQGMSEFRNGHYDQAVVHWLGAAESNHANAACRLHAGHAMFALGRYREGVQHIARAHELSPSLAYKTFDIRDEYGDTAEFDEHLAALQAFVARHPDDPSGMAMLGYVTFHTQGPAAALPVLERAGRLDRQSFFIPKLLQLARQASPTTREFRSNKSQIGHNKSTLRNSPNRTSTLRM
ncbi:MAG TPA: hypothetical protein VJZ71_02295 [Phycisphaerae bacterium]|nr:hypothetical protein [Phycisphaerae bacterium]